MAVAESPFLLDTGAWVAVRRRRLIERTALWAGLVGGIVLIVALAWGGLALYRSLSHRVAAPAEPKAAPVVPAPPIAKTPVLVWNGLGEDGVAAEAARQMMIAKYPIVSVGNAPDSSYMRTYVMYQAKDPAGPAAARRLIDGMHLDGAVVQPMDGIRDDQLAGARLLVIVAEPLRH